MSSSKPSTSHIFKSEHVPPCIEDEDNNLQKNYVEGYIIVQEFHTNPSILVVGKSPYGRIWFDREMIHEHFVVLLKEWTNAFEESEEKITKKPRIIKT